jgi:hypothetical protein
MMPALPPHLFCGAIGSITEARSIVRWSAGLYIAVAVAMLACEQMAAYSTNAVDWSPREGSSQLITWLVILAPPIGLLASRFSAAAGLMVLVAALLTIFLGGLGFEMSAIAVRFTNPQQPLNSINLIVVGPLLFAALWLVTTFLAWRAFLASRALKRLSAGGTPPDVRVFD